jgi:type I restriction enzyme R subunit
MRIAGGVGRVHQSACIDTLCRAISSSRQKVLVEMATGTWKTRTAAALMKRLFEANWATRALFVVDRNTLAIQAEDAFAEHLPSLLCYRVPRTGRRFQDEKRVTIVTLQTLVNEYDNYISGYFDLICDPASKIGSDVVLMKALFIRGPSRGLGGGRGFRGRTSGA